MCFRNHPESKQLMRIWNIKLIKLSCVDKVFDFLEQIAGFCQWLEAGQEVPTYGRDEQCCAGSDDPGFCSFKGRHNSFRGTQVHLGKMHRFQVHKTRKSRISLVLLSCHVTQTEYLMGPLGGFHPHGIIPISEFAGI